MFAYKFFFYVLASIFNAAQRKSQSGLNPKYPNFSLGKFSYAFISYSVCNIVTVCHYTFKERS